MLMQTVDLYTHFQLPAPEQAVGKLTCYIPDPRETEVFLRSRPAVLILPGGGYHETSARESEPVALRFLAKGYCAFVLHYSCAPHRFPTALREAAMAMRYIRENADTWSIGTDKVAAIGFSAGGHLCGTLGMLYDCPEVRDLGAAALLRPNALGLCYPVTVSDGKAHTGSFNNLCGDDTALRQRLSLVNLVRADMPPVFLWHTRDDSVVPVQGTLRLATALEEMDLPFALHIYRQGPHGLSVADEQVYPASAIPQMAADVPGWIDAMVGFFAEVGLLTTDAKLDG